MWVRGIVCWHASHGCRSPVRCIVVATGLREQRREHIPPLPAAAAAPRHRHFTKV